MFRLISRFLPVLIPIVIKFIRDRRHNGDNSANDTGTDGTSPRRPSNPGR